MLPLILASGFFADWAAAWGSNLGGIVLVVIGMILIVVEMLIPGFGAAGVSGGVALIAGLIIGSNNLTGAMFSLLIVVILLAVFATIIFRSALHGKLSRSPVVLNTSIDAGSTERSEEEMQSLVGLKGKTVTALRPSGIAMIDGRRIDVSSEAEFIDKGVDIEVESIDGVKILVRRA
jgi:membrane-bound serine protease (ClpP class)